MSASFLDDEAHTAFLQAVTEIEETSSVEVVIAVRRRSHEYRHANLIIGAAVAFIALSATLFAQQPFGLAAILIDPFVVALAAGALVELLPGVKRLLTLRSRRYHHVARAARATFVDRGVHATASRAGLLVYISWLEQQVVLVPDTALARALPGDALASLEGSLTGAMGAGGAEVARVLAKAAPELARAAPRRAEDVNELPDAIDSDLGPRR